MVITGVIIPPPEIRAVADRTALFVAKHGRGVEARILGDSRGQQKFNFLNMTNPFHAYYEERIRFHENPDEASKEKEEKEEEQPAKEYEQTQQQQEEQEKKTEKAQKASAQDPIARALLSQRAKINEAKAAVEEAEAKESETLNPEIGVLPPPKLNFVSVAAPANLSSVQLETVKLVAQLAALNGTGGPFLHQLAMREWNNPEFAFVQPRHGHFAYFSALVDGYLQLLSKWTSNAESGDCLPVRECATGVSNALKLAAYRAEYDRDVSKRRREEMEANGGRAFSDAAFVDWHDFVVVETIDFPMDEVLSTPAFHPPAAGAEGTTEEVKEGWEDEDGERIRVVPNYAPKVVSTQNVAQDTSRTHAIDPITKESVALTDTSEHMRIQFLDPKWAEERKKFVDKQKESNLVGGDVIAGNISRFAQAIGVSDSVRLGTEADSKKRLEEANRVILEQAQQPQQPLGIPGAVQPQAVGPNADQQPLNSGTLTTSSMPSLQSGVAASSHPDETAPPAKRPRIEMDGLPHPNAALQFPPPQMNMPMPNAEVAALPGLGPTEPSESPQPVEKLSEADFVASLEDPNIRVCVQIPRDTSSKGWNLNGQVVTLTVNVMSKVKVLREDLRTHLGGMPMNKIQLKSQNSGFMKDDQTLASLNIGPESSLEMIPKKRGGRK